MLSAVCGIYLVKLHNWAITSVKSAAFADKLNVRSCAPEAFYVPIAVPVAAYPVLGGHSSFIAIWHWMALD
jgi:hypothetical protein